MGGLRLLVAEVPLGRPRQLTVAQVAAGRAIRGGPGFVPREQRRVQVLARSAIRGVAPDGVRQLSAVVPVSTLSSTMPAMPLALSLLDGRSSLRAGRRAVDPAIFG